MGVTRGGMAEKLTIEVQAALKEHSLLKLEQPLLSAVFIVIWTYIIKSRANRLHDHRMHPLDLCHPVSFVARSSVTLYFPVQVKNDLP